MNSPEGLGESARTNLDCASSPFVDIEFLSALLGGLEGSPEFVIEIYRQSLAERLMPFHPLIDPHQLPRRVRDLLRSSDLASIVEWLTTRSAGEQKWSELWDPREIGASLVPDSRDLSPKRLAEARSRAAVAAFAALSPDQPLPGFAEGQASWGELRLSMIRLLRDGFWQVDPKPPVPVLPTSERSDSVTVLICDNFESSDRLVRSVWSLSERSSLLDVSILVSLQPHRRLHGMFEIVARVQGAARCVVAIGGGDLRESVIRAVNQVGTEVLVILDSDVGLRDGALESMTAALAVSSVAACQPVLARPDGTIAAVGLGTFPQGAGLIPLLEDLAPADLSSPTALPVQALAPGVIAARTEAVQSLLGQSSLPGTSSLATELSIRASEGGQILVLRDASAILKGSLSDRLPSPSLEVPTSTSGETRDPWKECGWEVRYISPPTKKNGRIAPILIRPDQHPFRHSPRWAIKIGAGFSKSGDRWGDVPFAEDIAQAFRLASRDAVVDRYHPEFRRESYLDDVILVLRGRYAIKPVPGRLNILWVISQPERIDTREFDGFDIIAAASQPWAQWASEVSGRDVHVVLQAANERRFHPDRAPLGQGDSALFVGGARPPIGRKVVADAREAGIPLELWGPRWLDYGFAEFYAGDYFPNSDLPKKYSHSGVVLSDHTSEMRRHGFISNRVFEAVASGARVISDAVEGIDDIFGRSVRTYRSVSELRELFMERDRVFPDEDGRRQAAADVMEKHSIRARVQELLRLAESSRRLS